MKTIRDLMGLQKTTGEVGLEIEVEGSCLPRAEDVSEDFLKYWRITTDGSLRGESWEYVFKQPLSLEETKTALQLLESEYIKEHSIISDSGRAGIHVHINVQELTLQELITYIVLYYVVEEILVDFCGEGRQGNHFCLRWKDAEYVLWAIQNSFKTNNFIELATDNIRYSSLNLLALFKYGSLEFRALRSTANFNRVLNWITILLKLKEKAKKDFSNPVEIIESLSLNGGENFLKILLEDLYPIIKEFDSKDKIIDSVRTVQEISYLVSNFDLGEIRIRNLPILRDTPKIKKDYIFDDSLHLSEYEILEMVEEIPPLKLQGKQGKLLLEEDYDIIPEEELELPEEEDDD